MENNLNMEQPEAGQVEVANAKLSENISENIVNNVEEKVTSESATLGSIGKFKDAESLLSAYNSLQAEFTRKCQKLSELEGSLSEQNNAGNSEVNINEYVKNNQGFVQQILTNYLEGIKNNNAPISISNSVGSGIPLSAPPKPTTLEEAGEVVKKLFKN